MIGLLKYLCNVPIMLEMGTAAPRTVTPVSAKLIPTNPRGAGMSGSKGLPGLKRGRGGAAFVGASGTELQGSGGAAACRGIGVWSSESLIFGGYLATTRL